MRKLVLVLAVLGGLLMLLAGVVVTGFFYFSFPGAGAGVDQEEALYLESDAARGEMAMASTEEAPADFKEAPSADAAAPSAQSSARKVAAAAPVASVSFANDAKVIRNGALTLVVANPAGAVEQIQQIIAGIPGAFIAAADVRQAGDVQPTTLTLRVPAESFDGALAALRALAQEVLAEQVTARDVTEEYTDLDARLRNLRAAETQLLALLEQARIVEDLLKIEQRLAEVRGEIERLQGRLNVLADRIALATIQVRLHAPPDLSVVIAAENVPAAHAVTSFALTYRNAGSVPARDSTLTLSVPERLNVYDVGQGGSYDPITRIIRWNLADVAPGTQGTLYAQLRVEDSSNDILLQAEIRSAHSDANVANNTAGLTLSFAPDLALEVGGPAAGAQGSEVSIWISYSNVGTADAADVTVKATLPAGLTFVRADFGGSYDREDGTVEWKLGRVHASTSGEVFMRVRVDVDEGRLRIPVTVSAEQADAVTFNNQAEVFLTALREDFSERSIWQPGQTVETSIAALVVVARTAVDVLIWALTFGIPLGIVALLAFGARAGLRRWRRRQGG